MISAPLHRSLLLLIATAFSMLAGAAQAQQAWPTKPVRIIVSTAAGGASDIVARLLAERLAQVWKQQVLVDILIAGRAHSCRKDCTRLGK